MTLEDYLKTCPGKYPFVEDVFKDLLSMDISHAGYIMVSRTNPSAGHKDNSASFKLLKLDVLNLVHQLDLEGHHAQTYS